MGTGMSTEPENHQDLKTELADLKLEVTALRKALTTALLIVLLLTLALNGLFLWQSRVVRRQLAGARLELAQYKQNTAPVMEEFISRLQKFAAVTPDFAPIMGKYIPSSTNTLNPRVNLQVPRTNSSPTLR